MIIDFANTRYECEKAVKSNDSAILYLMDGGIIEFGGISDFSAFILSDGEWTEDTSTTTEERVSDLEDTTSALEDAICEMDAANEERMAAIEDALCEMDMG